ncbi:hypothetical protein A5677_17045 [Mycobacterium malmoense]|uniref:DUF732 domain-containing protein n=1 Tax=Mycobacterium malmoense TaxID=1780 RepID=A0A1B9DA84_MYCMA|nr:hypothetical protein A5677_17045 [Mycobacterium malmoense]
MKRLLICAVAAGLVLIGAASAPAHADPVGPEVTAYAIRNANRVCVVLTAFPNFAGVMGVMDGIQKDTGFTNMETAQALVLSVESTCPQWLPLLQKFADAYAPATSGVRATV